MQKERMDTRKMVTLAMLCALAYVITVVARFSLVPALPFLKYDPKDVILAIGGFLYGPASVIAMAVTVCLIEMVSVSDSGIVGFIMNLLSTLAFVLPAALFYRKKHTISGAALGLLCGIATMVITMLLWNYIVTPIYYKMERAIVAEMLLPVFLPFNAVKGGMNMALTLLLYQPVNNALRRAKLLPPLSDGAKRRKLNLKNMALAAVLLAVCIVVALIMLGKI